MENEKIALITGVSRKEGIGFETARQLGLKGFTVVISARQLNQAELLVQELAAEQINAFALSIDLTSDKSVGQAVEDYQKNFGYLDVLINNKLLFDYYEWGFITYGNVQQN